MPDAWISAGRGGPLEGLRIVELASPGPVPFAAMQLADLGADVIRVDRVDDPDQGWARRTVTTRSRRSIALDLKQPPGRAIIQRLLAGADVLLEGYRPGVAERLGLGDDALRAINPALVVGRVSAWGQTGPDAHRGGFDLTCLAESGILSTLGRGTDPPAPPANLLGDLAGGAMFLIVGVLGALYERQRSGLGQTVDASMLEGLFALSATVHGLDAAGAWAAGRESNVLTGGSPFYDVYECMGGGMVALTAFDPRAYAAFLSLVGLEQDVVLMQDRSERENWPAMRERISQVFLARDRAWWSARSRDPSGCVNVVRELPEIRELPQVAARRSMVEISEVWQAAPTPRFSRTGSSPPRPAPMPGSASDAILAGLGLSADDIRTLVDDGVVGTATASRGHGDPFL